MNATKRGLGQKILLLITSLLGSALTTPVRIALAHDGQPLAPHDLWRAWNWSPVFWISLWLAGWAYARGLHLLGRRGGSGSATARWRAAAFVAGLAALFLALISLLDALSAALFSAHMAQHMLLILVAAPLLVLGTPLSPFLLALPAPARTVLGRWWKRTSWARMAWHTLTQPVVVWALHTLALWLWHAPGPYQAALGNESLHALEHFSFLSTALLFWWAVARTPGRRTAGQGVSTLYLFTMALQSGLLGVLITFAPQPWYPAYAATTPAWNLTPLEDQQLAGVIMWIPAGVVYLIAALVGLGLWLRVMERADRAMIETAQLEITN